MANKNFIKGPMTRLTGILSLQVSSLFFSISSMGPKLGQSTTQCWTNYNDNLSVCFNCISFFVQKSWQGNVADAANGWSFKRVGVSTPRVCYQQGYFLLSSDSQELLWLASQIRDDQSCSRAVSQSLGRKTGDIMSTNERPSHHSHTSTICRE